jgi:anion-transporting  ArsA/GET3 family ATPase
VVSLTELVEHRSVIVCCGSGGVGKTTTAAAIALGAAQRGRRACVVTVDPARRLADALGAAPKGSAPAPQRVEGPWSGSLDALMLDASDTFDRLVASYSVEPDQAERIFSNRLYRNLVSTLSGTQEYMASELLYELHRSGSYDVIVVDTPPSRDALDFLDAPRRLTSFLDNRLFRLLVAPGHGAMRAAGLATQLLLRTIAKVAGEEIVEDTVAFFRAFEGMEAGFRTRAAAVDELLAAADSAYVIVTTPRQAPLAEAAQFALELERRGRTVDCFVCNRMTPDFTSSADLDELGGDLVDGRANPSWVELVENFAELHVIREREEAALAPLLASGSTIARVELLDQDVHDVAGLGDLVRLLLNEALP